MATPAALELVAVTKRYDTTLAIDTVNLKIPAGTYCCLLGPSGCGKTSTLRMIAGHEAVSEGDIILGPHNVTGRPPARPARYADDVPLLRPVSASDGARQRRVRAEDARHRPANAPQARRRAA